MNGFDIFKSHKREKYIKMYSSFYPPRARLGPQTAVQPGSLLTTGRSQASGKQPHLAIKGAPSHWNSSREQNRSQGPSGAIPQMLKTQLIYQHQQIWSRGESHWSSLEPTKKWIVFKYGIGIRIGEEAVAFIPQKWMRFQTGQTLRQKGMPTIEGGVPPDFLRFLEGIPRRRLSLAWKPGKSNTQFRRSCDHRSRGLDPVSSRRKKSWSREKHLEWKWGEKSKLILKKSGMNGRSDSNVVSTHYPLFTYQGISLPSIPFLSPQCVHHGPL